MILNLVNLPLIKVNLPDEGIIRCQKKFVCHWYSRIVNKNHVVLYQIVLLGDRHLYCSRQNMTIIKVSVVSESRATTVTIWCISSSFNCQIKTVKFCFGHLNTVALKVDDSCTRQRLTFFLCNITRSIFFQKYCCPIGNTRKLSKSAININISENKII